MSQDWSRDTYVTRPRASLISSDSTSEHLTTQFICGASFLFFARMALILHLPCEKSGALINDGEVVQIPPEELVGHMGC